MPLSLVLSGRASPFSNNTEFKNFVREVWCTKDRSGKLRDCKDKVLAEPIKTKRGRITEIKYSCEDSTMHYLTDFNEIKMYWTITIYYDDKGSTGYRYKGILKVNGSL